jgi:hypothetical protein
MPELFKWIGVALALALIALTIIRTAGWASFSWWWLLVPVVAWPVIMGVIAGCLLVAVFWSILTGEYH